MNNLCWIHKRQIGGTRASAYQETSLFNAAGLNLTMVLMSATMVEDKRNGINVPARANGEEWCEDVLKSNERGIKRNLPSESLLTRYSKMVMKTSNWVVKVGFILLWASNWCSKLFVKSLNLYHTHFSRNIHHFIHHSSSGVVWYGRPRPRAPCQNYTQCRALQVPTTRCKPGGLQNLGKPCPGGGYNSSLLLC